MNSLSESVMSQGIQVLNLVLFRHFLMRERREGGREGERGGREREREGGREDKLRWVQSNDHSGDWEEGGIHQLWVWERAGSSMY